jgi:hypothetical protein
MKLAVLIRCYYIIDYLRIVLKSYSWVDKILLMNYRFTSVAPIQDTTEEAALSLNLPNLEIEKGEGIAQHEILNRGLDKLKEYDYVFISDADEIILPADQKTIVNMMQSLGMESGYCLIRDYFYDAFHHLPQRPGHSLVIVKPDKVRFIHIRSSRYNQNKRKDFNLWLHHFGFALQLNHLEWKMNWESIEEKTDVPANIRNMKISNCHPPEELLRLLGEA